MYAKDLSKPKYEILIKKCANAGIKYLNDPNAFIECFNTTDDVHENINDYSPSRKRKILIVFGDMIANIKSNKVSSHNRRIVYYVQKSKYFSCFYHSDLCYCFKRCEIKFNKFFDYEN